MSKPVQPLAVTTAANAHAVLTAQWAGHLKLCRDCRVLTPIRNRYCAEGWELAKQLATAANAISSGRDHQGDDQLTMF